MSRWCWLRSLARLFSVARAPRRAVRPGVEVLEDRLTPAGYTFTRIIDSSGEYAHFFIGVAINNSGQVAIPAMADDGRNAILLGSPDGAAPVVVIDSSEEFAEFGIPSLNDAGTVAFSATLDSGAAGVFMAGDGQLALVANVPPKEAYLPEINNAGAVVFRADRGTGPAVWLLQGGLLTEVIAAGSYLVLEAAVPDLADDGTVAVELTPLEGGGRMVTLVRGGQFTTVAQSSGLPAVDAGGVVFPFWDGETDHIQLAAGGSVVTVATSSRPFRSFFSPSINAGGQVAFLELLDDDSSGIFTGPDHQDDGVIATGDPLDGSTVSDVRFHRNGLNDHGQIAFAAALADGRMGVYLATPNTAPSVTANQPGTFEEGETAFNTGTFDDADGDEVTLTASVGTIFQPVGASGSWNWSMLAADGPALVEVTITATDAFGNVSTTTFTVNIRDVATVPTIDVPPSPVVGRPATFHGRFSDPAGELDGSYSYHWQATTFSGELIEGPSGHVSVPPDVADFVFTPQVAGVYIVLLTVTDGDGILHHTPARLEFHDLTRVSIEQAAGQDDPATDPTARFDVVFTQPVSDFDAADLSLSGTALFGDVSLTEMGPLNGAAYVVTVALETFGTVTVSLDEGAVEDTFGNGTRASTSRDNTVTYQSTDLYAVGQPGGRVQLFALADHSLHGDLEAFGPRYRGQTTVALADLTGDGVPDLIAAQRDGRWPRVRVFDGDSLAPLPGVLGDLRPFAAGVSQGVFVAAGDVSDDGVADVLVGSRRSRTGLVRAFSGSDGSLLFTLKLGAAFRGAARVAAGELTGDTVADLAVATTRAGRGRVRLLDGATRTALGQDLVAFDATPLVGTWVALGDTDGDGRDDLIVSTARDGGQQVEVYDALTRTQGAGYTALLPQRGVAVLVAATDVDGNGRADVLLAAGDGEPVPLECWDPLNPAVVDTLLAAGRFGDVYLAASR